MGVLQILGNYTQGAGGILNIELGDLIAGTQYDQLAVAANALLAGELDVELINAFNPTADASFDILLAGFFGTVSGTFDTLHFPTLPTGVVPRRVVYESCSRKAGICAQLITAESLAG